MKRDELLKHAKCSICAKGIGHTGLPLFWRVTVERFGVDLHAVQRQDGLGAFLGSHPLAAVMGPDEDLAMAMDKPAVLTVCEACGTARGLPVAALSEIGSTT